jgi:hypothetical protein
VLLRRTAGAGSVPSAAAEWLVWNHVDCWKSYDVCGLQAGVAYERRLEAWRRLVGEERALVTEVQNLIYRQHEAYSVLLLLEAKLRAWDLLGLEGRNGVKELLQRVIDRMRLLAEEPLSEEGRRSGLPIWFGEMMDRLSAEERGIPELAELIAQGLALADIWQRTERELQAGLEAGAYRMEQQEAARRVNGVVMDWDVELGESELVLRPVKSVKQPASPLGRLRTAGQRLTVTLQTGGGGVRVLGRELVVRREERISLPEGCSSLVLETAASRLELERVQRPAWAEKFWQDGFGLAAEFEIGGVKFVMRWIPTGRFLMGSPEGEQGRDDDEGPQHEVTITRGYWMGETPVTQAQWRAVVERMGMVQG